MMLKISEWIIELGFLTVFDLLASVDHNLEHYESSLLEHLPLVPIQGEDVILKIKQEFSLMINDLSSIFSKENMIMIGQEMIFFEELSKHNIIPDIDLLIHHSVSIEQYNRLIKNVPCNLNINFFRIPETPQILSPNKTTAIMFGLDSGSGLVLLPDFQVDSLTFIKKRFFGEIVLLNPIPFSVFGKPYGWRSVYSHEYFTQIYKPNHMIKALQ